MVGFVGDQFFYGFKYRFGGKTFSLEKLRQPSTFCFWIDPFEMGEFFLRAGLGEIPLIGFGIHDPQRVLDDFAFKPLGGQFPAQSVFAKFFGGHARPAPGQREPFVVEIAKPGQPIDCFLNDVFGKLFLAQPRADFELTPIPIG